MTATTEPFIVLVPSGASKEDWHHHRGQGATASEIHDIIAGGRKAWQTIADRKMNGSSFTGNAATRRGHEHEKTMLEFAASLADVVPNDALIANRDQPLHRGTPDGLGFGTTGEQAGRRIVVETKSKDHRQKLEVVPIEDADQVQWQMHIADADFALYIRGQVDEHGQPLPGDPWHQWIARDEHRIGQLVRAADAFNAWREAGMPEIDDVPEELDEQLANWAEAKELLARGKALEDGAKTFIRDYVKATPGATVDGLKIMGTIAGFKYTTKVIPTRKLDEDAWAKADPDGHAVWAELILQLGVARDAADKLEAEALGKHAKVTTSVAGTLYFDPQKGA